MSSLVSSFPVVLCRRRMLFGLDVAAVASMVVGPPTMWTVVSPPKVFPIWFVPASAVVAVVVANTAVAVTGSDDAADHAWLKLPR